MGRILGIGKGCWPPLKKIWRLMLGALIVWSMWSAVPISSASDEFAIAPVFESVQDFENGVALVLMDGKWGLINIAGAFIVKPKYDAVGAFLEGKAMVSVAGKWGFIDRNGREIVPVRYDSVTDYADGTSIVRLGNTYGFLDHSGKAIVPVQYERVFAYKDGLSRVLTENGYGFVNRDGVEVIKPQYLVATDYVNGHAMVREDRESPYYFIDKSGNVVNRTNYKYRGWDYSSSIEHNEGYIWVADDNRKWGVLDSQGKVVIPPQYEEPGGDEYIPPAGMSDGYSFQEGLAIVKKQDKQILINTKGEVLATLPEMDMEATYIHSYSDGLKVVNIYSADEQSPNLSIVLDNGEKEVFRINAPIIMPFEDGKSAIMINQSVAIIDNKGNIIRNDLKYDRINPFTDGIALFQIGNSMLSESFRMGAVNDDWEEVIPPVYRAIAGFRNHLAIVWNLEYAQGIINDKGEVIVEIKYDQISFPSEGMIAATLDGNKWGYIVQPGVAYDPSTAYLPPADAKPTASKVLVDGVAVGFEAYNINDNNYFKLRDIAMALRGSDKSFEVAYNASRNAIELTSGKPYSAIGGELAIKGVFGSRIANPTASKIYLDGEELKLRAYNIGGNNYFKLRDLGEALNIGVDWDAVRKTIIIDTKKGYVAAE